MKASYIKLAPNHGRHRRSAIKHNFLYYTGTLSVKTDTCISMRDHIVLVHPEPHSFNAKFAGISNRTPASAGYDIIFFDLCYYGFDAVEDSNDHNVQKDHQFLHTQTG